MANTLYSLVFWRDAAERAISTAAQSAIALLGVDGLGLLDVDWQVTASAAGLAALLSVLKSVAASTTGDGSASLASTRTPGRHAA